MIARILFLVAAVSLAGCDVEPLQPDLLPACADVGFTPDWIASCTTYGRWLHGPEVYLDGRRCMLCGVRQAPIPECTPTPSEVCITSCNECAPLPGTSEEEVN